MGRKFGWRSGDLKCQNGKILGDLYINDDIIFSDVSAGALSVTGGIDLSSTTSAIGLDFGGSFTTSAINIDGTLSNRAIMIGTKTTGIPISTGESVDAEPANNYLFGLFSVVEAAEATSTDELRGAWIRTRVDNACTIGTATGWGYGICGAEIQLKIYGATINSWQASALWAQLESQGATTVIASGCVASAVLARTGLTATTTIASGGVVAGVTIDTCVAGTGVTNSGEYYGLYIYQDNSARLDADAAIHIATGVADVGIEVLDSNIHVGSRTAGSGTDLATYDAGIIAAVQYTDGATLANTYDYCGMAGIFDLTIGRAITLASGGGYGWAAINGSVTISKAIASTGGLSAGWFAIWAEAVGGDAALTESTRINVVDAALVTGADFNAGASTKVYGVRVDSSVHASATLSGEFAAINIGKSSGKLDWKIGIDINNCTQAINAASTLAAATNVMDIITTDAGVLSSGTTRSLYIEHTVSGAKTDSAVNTGIGVIMSASAACASMMGAHIHIHNTTNNFTGNMVGMMIDFDDPGTAAGNVMLLDLYRDNTNVGASRDCYIRMKSGGTTLGTTAIYVEGTSNIMTDALFGFLGCGDTSFLKDGTVSGTIAYGIKVRVHSVAGDTGTEFYIPLYPTKD